MITVGEVLTTKAFEKAKVIAGNEGIHNLVRTITVAEVPDAAEWLRGQELVCTTGFFVRDNSVSQVRWIESLIHHGASALAIKTSRFLGDISGSVKIIANTRKFPIISLPDDSTWPFVIESVMNRITEEQIEKLRQMDEIHTRLTQLVLEGESVQSIAQTLALSTKNPVIVNDARFNIIGKGIPEFGVDGEKDALVYNYFLSPQFQKYMLCSDYYKKITLNRTPEALEMKAPKSPARFMIVPIFSSNVIYGFITLIETVRPYTHSDAVVLEHGATAIALKLVKTMIDTETQRAEAQQAIDALVQGRLLMASLRKYLPIGFNWSNPISVVRMNLLNYNNKGRLYLDSEAETIIEKHIMQKLKTLFGQCIMSNRGGEYTFLIPFRPEDISAIGAEIEKAFKECAADLEKDFGKDCLLVGIGGAYPEFQYLKKSYDEAQKVIEILETIHSLRPVACYNKLGIYKILFNIKDQKELSAYYKEYLSEIIIYDRKNNGDLLETLRTYVMTDGNITHTAKKLFLHPNTVTYRLKKIQTLLPESLDNYEFRTAVYFALKIYDLFKDAPD
ncbi:purine catabolism regulatory protein [Desulfitobacterium chlororespirans DSM 11544]|uniref:Purine catabolism regulatory protein n=2 Tax=Desulfitobacterium chlororespirans TaxID=51616 RepID=A0A1M7SEN1_9FIRM|nr:purine catabolism regulatory protein [Desulfitobacterium chlororespirans DSM 11544]